MARKKVREYDSKRILKEHLKRLAGIELGIKSAQVCQIFSGTFKGIKFWRIGVLSLPHDLSTWEDLCR
jgi:hypothetical protein